MGCGFIRTPLLDVGAVRSLSAVHFQIQSAVDVLYHVDCTFLQNCRCVVSHRIAVGSMPTGMESTIKVRIDDFLLTGVIFGSSLFTIGAKAPLSISGKNIMLFDRKSGQCIAVGSLEFEA